MFTPEKTVSYQGLVGYTAAQAMAGAPLIDGPVKVRMNLLCPIPASWSRLKQWRAREGHIRPTTKPDVDNVIKAVFDAINGVVWKDDVQVVELVLSKGYAENPGVRVLVEAL
jgi:Holliday junction resolvase RusA-like endonuclease